MTRSTRKYSYVGQTSPKLKQKYKKHIRYIKYNDPQTAYAAQILNNLHEKGPIDNTMPLNKHVKKGPSHEFFRTVFHSIKI